MNLTPQILSAQVFAADGVTAVVGKGPLIRGSDYSLNYSAAPNCQLDMTMLTAAGDDRSESTADRPLPDSTRPQHTEWCDADQYRWCDPVV